MDTVSVFHIDPSQLFREGLKQLLRDFCFKIAGEATSLSEGLKQLADNVPSVVLIEDDGNNDALLTLMKGVSTITPLPRVVVLTQAFRPECMTTALCNGVDGYLLKNMSPEGFRQSLNLVMTGEKVFPTDLADLLITNPLIAGSNGKDAKKTTGGKLSEREEEILSCLVCGNSNKDIANSLCLTEGTVKVHVKSILKKIHVRNRTQAAIWALNNGIKFDAVGEQSNGYGRQLKNIS